MVEGHGHLHTDGVHPRYNTYQAADVLLAHTHIHNMLPHDAGVIMACYVYKRPLAATCCAIMTVAELTGIT